MFLAEWLRWMCGNVSAKRPARNRRPGCSGPLRLECLESRCVLTAVQIDPDVVSGWYPQPLRDPAYADYGYYPDVYAGDGAIIEGGFEVLGGAWTKKSGYALRLSDSAYVPAQTIYNHRWNKNRGIMEFDLNQFAGATINQVSLMLSDTGGKPYDSPDGTSSPTPNEIHLLAYDADLQSTSEDYNRPAQDVTTFETNAGQGKDAFTPVYTINLTDLVKSYLSQGKTQLGLRFEAVSSTTLESFGSGSGRGVYLDADITSFTPDAGGPYAITEGDSLQLDASNTENPDDLPLTYSWDIHQNGTWVNGVASGQTATLDASTLKTLGITATNSPYQVRVKATDSFSGTTRISDPTDLTVDPAPTDLVASSLTWDAKNGGVQCNYTITGTAPTQPVDVRFSWASGTTLATARSSFTLKPESPDFSISAQRLGQPPAGAKYLLMQLDPNNKIPESKENNNLLPLAYQPQIESITAKYSVVGNTQSIGRFFSGVPLNGQVFTVTLNDDLAAIRPVKVTLTVGSGKLVLTPQSGTATWNGKTYVSAAYDGTGGLAPKTYQLTAATQVGALAVGSKQIGMDVVAVPTRIASASPIQKHFDSQTQSYIFAISLFSVNSSTGTQFALPSASSTWFGSSAKSGLDAQVSFQAITGFDPTQQPNVTGQAQAQLSVLGQSLYSFNQSYQSPQNSGKFGADVNLDPRTMNINSAIFTYTDSGSKALNFDSKPINKPPFTFSYHLQTTLKYTAALQLTLNKNGTLNAGQSSIDFTVKADPLNGNLTITDITLGPLFGNKVLSVLTNALKGVPGLLANFLAGKLKDVGLLPTVSGNAVVTGTLNLNGHAGLGGALLKLGLTQPKLTTSLKLSVPAVIISFTWLGDTVDLGSISLGNFLEVKMP